MADEKPGFKDEIAAAISLGVTIADGLKEKGFDVDWDNDNTSGEMFVKVGDYQFAIRTTDFELVEPDDEDEFVDPDDPDF